MALFITFEGGEGSGKSTQARKIYQRLCDLAVPALLTYEPGVTALGEKIAGILRWGGEVEITPVAELLLFNASRAQLVTEVIRPGLEAGKIVFCDRYADSTTAYQGYGRGLSMPLVRAVNETGTLGLKPDLTFLLDIPVEEAMDRKKNAARDRFEQEDFDFHRRVREGYLKLAAAEPSRWLVIDARQDKELVAGIIWERVSRFLSVPGA